VARAPSKKVVYFMSTDYVLWDWKIKRESSIKGFDANTRGMKVSKECGLPVAVGLERVSENFVLAMWVVRPKYIGHTASKRELHSKKSPTRGKLDLGKTLPAGENKDISFG
jgi:hypothetical protein